MVASLQPAPQLLCLLWWSYLSILMLSPTLALAQGSWQDALTSGCRWNEAALALDCSGLELTRIPHIPPNISGILRQLDLRSNNIRDIDDEVFSARYMPHLQHLFLSRNQLSHLPLNVFQFAVFTTLDLSYNNFKYPPPALSNTDQIATLLLNNNPFEGLMKNSLENISFLTALDLSACNLTANNVDPRVFSALRRLRTLYLDNNHFPYVQQRMFGHMHHLRDLYMQQCGILDIEKRSFKYLNSLNGLFLAQNNISELYPNTFRDSNMKILDLSYCGIQNIRKGAFRTRITDRLYLSHNNITVLHSQDFKDLKAVKYLDLSYSNVSEIKGSPFVNLSYLEVLHLQHNRLEDKGVNADTLKTSGRLSYLDLTGNMFTSIPDVSGRYLPHLHRLDISENRISYIGHDQLRNMTSLYVLVLRGNPLEYVHNDAFMECKRVSDLNLDFTRIKRLPDMSNMARLTDLHIIHSSLEYFPEDFCTTNPHLIIVEATANNLQTVTNFSGCHNLSYLALDNNQISEISHGVFTGLSKLEILKLHENHISYIAPAVFDNLIKLKSLTLDHNNITDLPLGIFSRLTSLQKLDLGFNHISILQSGVFANNTLLSGLWLNNNNIHEVHPVAFTQMPYLQTLVMSFNYFCYLEFPEAGFPSLRVLGLEQLWCLHNVPEPYTIPNAQEIYYTYAYHCHLWEEFLNSTTVYLNDSVLPPTLPPTLPPITFPTHSVPTLPDNPFEQDCNREGASPDQNSLIEDIAKLYNLTVVLGPDCRLTIENPLGLTADEIVNLRNGQPTATLDEMRAENTEREDSIEETRKHVCYPQQNADACPSVSSDRILPHICREFTQFHLIEQYALTDPEGFVSSFCTGECVKHLYDYFKACDKMSNTSNASYLDLLCTSNAAGEKCARLLSNSNTFGDDCSAIEESDVCPRNCRAALQEMNHTFGCCFYTRLALLNGTMKANEILNKKCSVENPGLCKRGALSGNVIVVPGEEENDHSDYSASGASSIDIFAILFFGIISCYM